MGDRRSHEEAEGMTMETPLPELDPTVVADVARRLLDSDTADIAGWEVSPLNYDRTTPTSGGVYRVAGTRGKMDRPGSGLSSSKFCDRRPG
jgi:hypothetical protein